MSDQVPDSHSLMRWLAPNVRAADRQNDIQRFVTLGGLVQTLLDGELTGSLVVEPGFEPRRTVTLGQSNGVCEINAAEIGAPGEVRYADRILAKRLRKIGQGFSCGYVIREDRGGPQFFRLFDRHLF